jgi:hypothetical protein
MFKPFIPRKEEGVEKAEGEAESKKEEGGDPEKYCQSLEKYS